MANPAASLVPSLDKFGHFVRDAWDRLQGLPGGKALYSRLVSLAAPYTGSIAPQIVELSRGHAKVTMKDRRAVRNHIQSVHAIALANLAELAGNSALQYSLPDDGRFIVAGMTMEYLKKARGTITATAACPIPETSERREYEVIVELRDAKEDLVARAVLKSLVGPKKKKAD